MKPELDQLIKELSDLQVDMARLVRENGPNLARIQPESRASARNLFHYLAFRRHDLRNLQNRLTALGLSSLGRIETDALSGVRAVLKILERWRDGQGPPPPSRGAGLLQLERNTNLLLGPEPEERKTRIMVTMPSEAATNYALVKELLNRGMNCMRINCAHDGAATWEATIRHLRQAEKETGRRAKVEMDLAGPKLRTGPIAPGVAVVKCRPRRDALGRVEAPARLWLTPRNSLEVPPADSGTAAVIPVPSTWLATLNTGDEVRFTDTRGARRTLKVVEVVGRSCWAEIRRTAYLTTGTQLKAVYGNKSRPSRRALVGTLPEQTQTLRLRAGDTLILTRSLKPGRPAEASAPARIGVTLPEFFDCVEAGQPIWFDDGKIGGMIREVDADEARIEITQAKADGSKLGAEKGINVPETNLVTPTLTEEDLLALPFIVQHADLVGYSFVRTQDDIRLLQAQLTKLGARRLGIVLKIETRAGFENLPDLLLAAMGSHRVGVMIARGDLAIECGYQRLAEAQEEILWISAAAHVPVIWATQVLETLARTGTPSRSEITDAAMGERAECVMLNKGPFVAEAVGTLDDILRRMQDHQEKKRSMLRKLGLAVDFSGDVPATG